MADQSEKLLKRPLYGQLYQSTHALSESDALIVHRSFRFAQ